MLAKEGAFVRVRQADWMVVVVTVEVCGREESGQEYGTESQHLRCGNEALQVEEAQEGAFDHGQHDVRAGSLPCQHQQHLEDEFHDDFQQPMCQEFVVQETLVL